MTRSCDRCTRCTALSRGRRSKNLAIVVALQSFRSQYTALPPVAGTVDADWQLISLNSCLRRLTPAPATYVIEGNPPPYPHETTHRYIWVIDSTGIPYIFEKKLQILGNEKPKHTNLTAGGTAYIGGEIWFRNTYSIYLSGGSGRYPARTEQHLSDAVNVFQHYGYEVQSLGWNKEMNKAKRTL